MMRHRFRSGWPVLLALLLASVPDGALAASAAKAATPTEGVMLSDIIEKGGTPPRAIKRQAPDYPPGAARIGLIGDVVVDFVINEQGEVVNPVIVRSNNPWFERPAIEAILGWKFAPAMVDGRPVSTRAAQLLEFQMRYSAGHPLWQVGKPQKTDATRPELQWDVPPEPVSSAFPVYPWDDLVAETAGSTRIKMLVDPNGKVAVAQVESATTPAMGAAVLAMAGMWRFTPPKKKDGSACYAALGMEHTFSPFGTSGDVPVSPEARDILKWMKNSPEKIATWSELDEAPRPLSRRPPIYPLALSKTGQAGSAIIEFFVDRRGDAQLPRVVSSTAPEFGYAAAQAVATWRFTVPKRKGKPVVTRVRIPLEFSAMTTADAK